MKKMIIPLIGVILFPVAALMTFKHSRVPDPKEKIGVNIEIGKIYTLTGTLLFEGNLKNGHTRWIKAETINGKRFPDEDSENVFPIYDTEYQYLVQRELAADLVRAVDHDLRVEVVGYYSGKFYNIPEDGKGVIDLDLQKLKGWPTPFGMSFKYQFQALSITQVNAR